MEKPSYILPIVFLVVAVVYFFVPCYQWFSYVALVGAFILGWIIRSFRNDIRIVEERMAADEARKARLKELVG